MNKKLQRFKTVFEHNYLDGDKIQKGQMLSSEECFEAIKEIAQLAEEEERERVLGIIEKQGVVIHQGELPYAIHGLLIDFDKCKLLSNQKEDV